MFDFKELIFDVCKLDSVFDGNDDGNLCAAAFLLKLDGYLVGDGGDGVVVVAVDGVDLVVTLSDDLLDLVLTVGLILEGNDDLGLIVLDLDDDDLAVGFLVVMLTRFVGTVGEDMI